MLRTNGQGIGSPRVTVHAELRRACKLPFFSENYLVLRLLMMRRIDRHCLRAELMIGHLPRILPSQPFLFANILQSYGLPGSFVSTGAIPGAHIRD